MRRVIYFDTSALAKWYLNEPRSDEVEKYIQEEGPVDISELTLVEMRSLLARHRREGQLDLKKEIAVFACFEEDVRQNFLVCHPFPADIAAGAVNLISMFTEFSIRTLDALHLVIAKEIQAEILATADRVMATAAKSMGFSVVEF